MKLLLTNIDNAPLDTILTYFKVQRRDEQPERDWTLYFSPWHKDRKRVLRVSNGHRKGGLYASPLWEVPESTTDKVGYGAIALTEGSWDWPTQPRTAVASWKPSFRCAASTRRGSPMSTATE